MVDAIRSSHYELKAILIALQTWVPHWSRKSIIVSTDSATAQSNLRRLTLKDSSENKDLNVFTSNPPSLPPVLVSFGTVSPTTHPMFTRTSNLVRGLLTHSERERSR